MHNGIDLALSLKDKSLLPTAFNIYKRKYDIVFDLHKNIRSLLLTLAVHGITLRYRKNTLKKLLLVLFKINLLSKINPVYRQYLELLRRFKSISSLNYSTNELLYKRKSIKDYRYIVAAPSSKHFTKRLPQKKYIDILNSIKDYRIFLVGGNNKEDIIICEDIASQVGGAINLCGKMDYPELAGLIKDSEYVICNDSGILHLSEYLSKKVFVFFGSTVKEFGFSPQLTSTSLFEVRELKCRPCTHIGLDYCPKKHFKCMEDINLQDLHTEIENFR